MIHTFSNECEACMRFKHVLFFNYNRSRILGEYLIIVKIHLRVSVAWAAFRSKVVVLLRMICLFVCLI